ncbi:DNA mismatch repair endonuclease MutL [Bacteroidetes/Chlorobi group bacterium ChocPot_Mid]|nr:MAG: DNA mismatch repair endonuclease MutL [Bacteroidetes/Chlorobi group bacterium ChocPot_Mid]
MKDKNKILILPDFIANQIAAGEVVQRPESVVKELVENALDAGATEVAVVVKMSGKQLIHVVDNGCGIDKDDLELSIKRHATSKLITAEDLEEIRTYGFRGEALASIASIALLEIRSKLKDAEHGWKLVAEPMKKEIISPISMDSGTQVFVKNLFYNVPARRKFLKSDLTEFRYISDTMIKFAIIRPDIRFTFYDNENLIFDVLASDPVKRIENILGKNISSSLIPVDYSTDTLKISGFVGEPLIAKQSKSGQYLFLNRRSIISKSLSYAIFSAFEHLLEKKSHPFYVLNIILDPKQVDVNVHPQKHEVKFEDEKYIYNALTKAVGQALQSSNLVPEIALNYQEIQSPFTKMNDEDKFVVVNKMTGEVISTERNYQEQRGQSTTSPNFQRSRDYSSNSSENKNFEISAFDFLFNKKKSENQQEEALTKGEFEKPVQMYWQVHRKYICTQTDKGFIVVDQHAAHERILYEKALKAMNKEYSYSQDLMFPIEVELDSSKRLLVKELEKDLVNLGFVFDEKVNGKISIKAVPLDVVSGSESESFKEIVEQYEEESRLRDSTTRDNLAASFSCKAAIKTGKYLTGEEMKKLIDELFNCSMPYVCPHGRPVIIEFTIPELDRRFGRML